MANPIKNAADEFVLNSMINGEPTTQETYVNSWTADNIKHKRKRAKNKAAKKARRNNRGS